MSDGAPRARRAVLGIDAAWTHTQPSGVALVVEQDHGWKLAALGPSHTAFHDACVQEVSAADAASPARLLASSRAAAGSPVTLVAADIPLALDPITGRRAADNMVSRAYGGRRAGTHSPSALRPGTLSDKMTADFARQGYPLLTAPPARRGLIEVYPHPALIELTGAPLRLPYKHAKSARYWPDLAPDARKARLLDVWDGIAAHLESRIGGVEAALALLPRGPTGRAFKAWEDALDAIVCAWVGVCALEEAALAFGDDRSAIWIPAPIG
ncbi:DUF429 domain-containing protein [Pelagibacterium montanilacus]|uniref:DUF429 domain-containing protein n=1 Tax=Pelagibacterium montanilacus TaxID=2185280 RepID=UPI000F8E7B9C|nr:DUF429 domain-containing protein [Pelagibacterium montanilacus]